MFRALIATLVIVWTLAAMSAEAVAQKRVALVIGNGAYTKVPALPNPTNDAAAVEKLLRGAGFEVVRRADNLKLADLRKTIRDFSADVATADIAVVFFAGHGIEVNGTNYLIPIDAVLQHDVDVQDEAFPLDRVNQALEPAKRLRLIVLDACRDNPFVRSMKRTVAGRSIGRGLAAVELLTSDTLIAYAARAGYTAADGTGKNSPYTLALLNHLTTPGLDVRLALGRVRDEVLKTTAQRQEPWVYGSLGGAEVALVTAKPAEPPKKVEPTAPSPLGQAATEWDALRTRTDIAELVTFAARHKGTYFADLAKARIDELKKQQVAVTKVDPPPIEQKKTALFETPAPKQLPEATPKAKLPEPIEQKTAMVQQPEKSSSKALLPTRPAKSLTVGEERGLKPKDTFKECAECPEMVALPAGEFLMGSPAGEQGHYDNAGPQRKVAVAKPFTVGKFEVTFAEWDACVAATGCKHKPDDATWGRGRRPVINVSWDDITKDYLPWLSRKTGKTYRLLTEAEWEYAARAGTRTPFSTGHFISTDQANFDGTNDVKGVNRQKTREVGTFAANAFGLHDVHGNVSEWVEDCYRDSYSGAPIDGSAVASGDCGLRVLRGGSWSNIDWNLRSANRLRYSSDYRYFDLGFRVARSLSQ